MAGKDSVTREWKKVLRKEKKHLAPKKDNPIGRTMQPVTERVNDAIPQKALDAMEIAFAKGFALVFEQGTGMIEKTFDKNKRKAANHAGEALWEDGAANAAIRTMERSAKRSARANKAITTVEGGALGLLGIGMPDIPVYVGVLLKSIYEIALSYGYEYVGNEEQIYILTLIATAATENDERERYAARADKIGMLIDGGQEIPVERKQLIDEVAGLLASRLLMAKFVQGLPIIGAVGAVTNYTFLSQVCTTAEIKYKKRQLRSMQKEK